MCQMGRTKGQIQKQHNEQRHAKLYRHRATWWAKSILYINPGGVQRKRASQLLSGLLVCGDCGRKLTSQFFHQVKQRASGKTWVYERNTYRCISFTIPKSDNPHCNQRIHNAEDIDERVVKHAKNFIAELDIEKLLVSMADKIREQERENAENLKKISRDITQKERELPKYFLKGL